MGREGVKIDNGLVIYLKTEWGRFFKTRNII